MAKQQRRKHTAEFKREAVRLVEETSKSATQIAAELDIPRNTLNRWRKELRAEPTEAFRGHGRRTEVEQRIWELERENDRLKRERDILKKVVAIVSQP